MSETSNQPQRRQARLFLTGLDPWSVTRTAFVLSLGLAIVIIVAFVLIWLMLVITGTFETITQTVSDVGGTGAGGFDMADFLSFGRVLGVAFLFAGFEIVLTTALAAVMASIYNLTVGFTGGVEVTLSESRTARKGRKS